LPLGSLQECIEPNCRFWQQHGIVFLQMPNMGAIMAQITNSSSGFSAWDAAGVAYTGAGAGLVLPTLLFWATNGGVAPFNQIVATSSTGNITQPAPTSFAGTIDAISISSDTGIPKLSITDISVQLSSLFIGNGDLAAAYEAFWDTVLAGTTTFNLTAGMMNVMGDYTVVKAGQTKVGAVDTFTGSLVGLNGYLSGDAINVALGGTLTGAADIFSFTSTPGVASSNGLTLIGDVGGNSAISNGRVNGGADRFTINVTQSQFSPAIVSLQLVGDVETMAPGGVLVGGADVVSLTNVASVALLAGDVRDAVSADITGGNDSITLQSNTNLLVPPSILGELSGDALQVLDCVLRGGADTIIVRDTNGSGIYGDALQINNTTLIGGNDAITLQNTATAPMAGLPPMPPPALSLVSGDARLAGGTGDFTGGNDTINVSNYVVNHISGDVENAANTGFFRGGNDIINYAYNYYAPVGGGPQILGDVQTAITSSFVGGNDTITITGSRGPGTTYSVLGDANSYGPAAAGTGVFTSGNDIITFNSQDPTSSALLVGDLGSAASSINTFRGGSDQLTGGARNDQIFGDTQAPVTATTNIGGSDLLNGMLGDDVLDGGAGSDTAAYNRLNQSVYVNLNGIAGLGPSADNYEAMGQGFDQLIGIENVIGSNLSDTLIGDNSANILMGLGGNDSLNGSVGVDTMIGGDGNDTYSADVITDVITETNAVLATGGNDIVYFSGAAGTFTLSANVERLVLAGTAGTNGTGNALANTLFGNSAANALSGLDGNDLIYGGAGADTLNGGLGGDSLYGGLGADSHIGGNDAGIDYARYDDGNYGNLTIRLDGAANVGAAALGDTYNGIEGLVGGLGNDTVVGNASANYLFGGGGADILYGLGGADYLNGGAGADRFMFVTALGAGNADIIADFAHAVDDIVLSQAIFAGIGATLDASEFQIGMANTATDRIIYNNVTGQLFYDANGNGAGGMTQFASVTAGTVLDIGDFVMV
jgi:Ca2+-binding RTX toxin-like protein